ncbi:hypothetical protein VTH06DRAFT_8059 [Thermothelomyces fergusii]
MQRRRTPPADREEAEFDIDRDVPADKDAQLLETTKNIINSQLARLDVPLLGTVSFDDSESETEDEDFMDYEDHDFGVGDLGRNEEAMEEEEEEDDDEEEEDEDDEDDEYSEDDDDEDYTEDCEEEDEGIHGDRGEDGEGNDEDKERAAKAEVQCGGGGVVERTDPAPLSKDAQRGTTGAAIGSRKRRHSMIS